MCLTLSKAVPWQKGLISGCDISFYWCFLIGNPIHRFTKDLELTINGITIRFHETHGMNELL